MRLDNAHHEEGRREGVEQGRRLERLRLLRLVNATIRAREKDAAHPCSEPVRHHRAGAMDALRTLAAHLEAKKGPRHAR